MQLKGERIENGIFIAAMILGALIICGAGYLMLSAISGIFPP